MLERAAGIPESWITVLKFKLVGFLFSPVRLLQYKKGRIKGIDGQIILETPARWMICYSTTDSSLSSSARMKIPLVWKRQPVLA
jgi:hypothetical protein